MEGLGVCSSWRLAELSLVRGAFAVLGCCRVPRCSTAVRLCPLLSLVTSPFLPQVFLMMFVVYFVVSESLSIKKEGRAYFTLWGNYGQWVFILLTTCTVVVHLSQATLADQQWLKYLNNRKGFTNFYQVAFLNTVFSTLAASLLFLLTVQVWRGLGGSSTWAGMCALVLLCQLVIRAQSRGRGSKGP